MGRAQASQAHLQVWGGLVAEKQPLKLGVVGFIASQRQAGTGHLGREGELLGDVPLQLDAQTGVVIKVPVLIGFAKLEVIPVNFTHPDRAKAGKLPVLLTKTGTGAHGEEGGQQNPHRRSLLCLVVLISIAKY
ncbi:MAG: hypothetical protein CMK89_04255 [Pseudomonadales bacterium]|nr:hypothetical protein [Pseudomonadales bacterium]